MKQTMRIWLALVLALCTGTTAWGYNLTTASAPTGYTVAFAVNETGVTTANENDEVTITVTSAENGKVGDVTAKGYMTTGGMRAATADIGFLNITLTEVPNSRQTVDENKEQVEFTFTMPAANVEVTVLENIPMSSCTVTFPAGDITYDRTEKKPVPTVKYGDNTLTAGTDYTVAYSDNTNAGTATVTITAKEGHEKYTGSTTATFTISPKSIDAATVTLRQGSSNVNTNTYTYDGNAKEPTAIVRDGSKTLTAGTDYTISYTNNTDAGTATATIVGQGNYTGGPSKDFTINKAASQLNFTTRNFTKQYTDDNFTQTVNVVKGEGTVSYRSTNTSVATVNATTGEVDILGTGTTYIYASITAGTNYNARNNGAYYYITVNGQSLSSATFGLSTTSFEYDGTYKEPTIYNAQLGTTTLTEGVDYYVSYSDNVNAGTAYAYIFAQTGSKYHGYAYMPFTITPKTTVNDNVEVKDGGVNKELTIHDMGNQQGSTVTPEIEVTTLNYYRSLNASDANAYTVCLPYAPPTSGNLKYYTLAGAEGTTLQFEEISGAPQAYTPYLVFASSTTDIGIENMNGNITMKKEVSNSSSASSYVLKGTLSGISHNDALGLYILQSGNRWGKVGSDTHAYIPPFRAYIESASGARILDSSFGGETTGINSMRTIDRDGTERWFDLNGRCVKNPTKAGIYINNGRKEIVK